MRGRVDQGAWRGLTGVLTDERVMNNPGRRLFDHRIVRYEEHGHPNWPMIFPLLVNSMHEYLKMNANFPCTSNYIFNSSP